jgi:hypothetical protein
MLDTHDDTLRQLTSLCRNRYFYGKLLDKMNLDLEQAYFNRKRWLLNRLTVGTGVVCGLGIAVSNDGSRLLIAPGVAIDPLGREIIVPAVSPPVDPRQPTDDCGRPAGDPITGARTVVVCLAYHECEADPVPVLVGDCCGGPTWAAGTVCERYRVLVRAADAPPVVPVCGLPNLFGPSSTPADVHAQLAKRISAPCPEVTGDPVVVLARVNLPESGPLTPDMIDLGPRPLAYSNDLLFELLFCLAEQQMGPLPTR